MARRPSSILPGNRLHGGVNDPNHTMSVRIDHIDVAILVHVPEDVPEVVTRDDRLRERSIFGEAVAGIERVTNVIARASSHADAVMPMCTGYWTRPMLSGLSGPR